jgi:hypothetical protein
MQPVRAAAAASSAAARSGARPVGGIASSSRRGGDLPGVVDARAAWKVPSAGPPWSQRSMRGSAFDLRALAPEVGLQPSTFRLRARCFASDWTEQDGNHLLAWGAASAWSDPNGSTRAGWMIIGMIKAHSIQRRMRLDRDG